MEPTVSHWEGAAAPWTLARAVRVYMSDVEARCTRSHSQRERLGLETFLGRVGDLPLPDVGMAVALDYRRRRLRDGASPATVNHECSALRRCLDFATAYGALERNPLRELRQLTVREGDRRRMRRAFTESELERFLAAARVIDLVRRRAFGCPVPQRPFFVFLAGSGARKSEALRLRWGHLSLEMAAPGGLPELDGMGVATLPAARTKNRKGRVIPLDPGTAAEMASLRRVHETLLGRQVAEDDPLFLTGRGSPIRSKNAHCLLKTFNDALAEAGIAKVNADGESLDLHALRVTYNTRLARAGVELGARQALMGHSDPRLTEKVYTDRDLGLHVSATHRMVLHEMRDLGVRDEDSLGILAAVASIGTRATPGGGAGCVDAAAEKPISSRDPLTEAASVSDGECMDTTTSASALVGASESEATEHGFAIRRLSHLAMPPSGAAQPSEAEGEGNPPAVETSTDELLAQARRLRAEGLHEAADALYEAAARRGGRA